MKKTLLILFIILLVTFWLKGDVCFQAVKNGNLLKVKSLVEENPGILEARDNKGMTPLALAGWYGKSDILKFLIARGADLNTRNKNGLTPLFSALDRGKSGIAKILIQNGANIKIRGFRNRTLLHMAARSGNVDIADLLIQKGINVNAKDSRDATPLQCITPGSHKKMIQFLIRKGADVNVTYETGVTILQTMILACEDNIAIQLIKRGARLETKDPYFNRTPLHWAAAKGRKTIVTELLKMGADINSRDFKNHTPLYLAGYHGHRQIYDILKSKNPVTTDTVKNFSPNPHLNQEHKSGSAALWYLGHCGWAIKTANHFLIFDYFNTGADPLQPALANGHINSDEIAHMNVTVFVTHGHRDHFDPVIYSWKNTIKKITYIYGFNPEFTPRQRGGRPTSKDYTGPDYIHIPPRTRKQIEGMDIATLRSNDSGVGFLVQVDGLSIFHAGDHAGWRTGEKARYQTEIDYIARIKKNVDIAFINVTGCHARCLIALEGGTRYALETLAPSLFIPTHAGDKEYIYQQFSNKPDLKKLPITIKYPACRGDMLHYRRAQQQ